MYRQKIYTFPNSREYEYTYVGNYGAKGEKRAPRKKATPEQIKKQNQYNRAVKVRRLIKQNFLPDDLWITLKPPQGKRKKLEEFSKDLDNFLKAMRRAYDKRGKPLKYIYRLEVGKRGGIHCHLLLNRIRGCPETDVLVSDKWRRYGGTASFTSIYESGGYKDLAEYIVKQPDEEVEHQLSFFDEEEREAFVRYSCSRNLARPEPEVKEFTHRTMRKLLIDGPTPTEGYYIDKDTIVSGVNLYTGMSFLRYTENRLNETRARWEVEDG